VKRVKRWKHDAVLDAMQHRLHGMPEAKGVRRQTVEHPFGTLKAWMGATHFLTRTLDKVRTEMSLLVLAYNIKRMITRVWHRLWRRSGPDRLLKPHAPIDQPASRVTAGKRAAGSGPVSRPLLGHLGRRP
jgi:hypothetical protein